MQPQLLGFCLWACFCLQPSLSAQVLKSGSLTHYTYTLIDDMPGKGDQDFELPNSNQFAQWKTLIKTLLEQNYSMAAHQAQLLNYELVEFEDANQRFYLLERQASGPYWGTYTLNPQGCRDLVIQSPHPKADLNTGKQGVYVFKQSQARFFCLAGTHRCNHFNLSPCDGNTTVCESSGEAYRISDVAHETRSIFQATTEALHEADSSWHFLQLHGFAKGTNDPYLILSNGTRNTPNTDPIASMVQALTQIDPTLDAKVAHLDLNWNRLIGFTNVQGRFLNGSADACQTAADTSVGAFIHIEQEKNRLRADSSKWDKMVQAVEQSFACQLTSTEPVSHGPMLKIYPNPARKHIKIILSGKPFFPYKLTITDSQGRQVLRFSPIRQSHFQIPVEDLAPGLYKIHLRSRSQPSLNATFIHL